MSCWNGSPEAGRKGGVRRRVVVPQPAWLQFGWRDIPTFVGIVAALAFSLSVMRSIGFFGILDLKLLPLLSTDDMLRNSLAALPAVAGAAGILLAPIVIIYQRLPTLFQLCEKRGMVDRRNCDRIAGGRCPVRRERGARRANNRQT